jgi:hypothetical protein
MGEPQRPLDFDLLCIGEVGLGTRLWACDRPGGFGYRLGVGHELASGKASVKGRGKLAGI